MERKTKKVTTKTKKTNPSSKLTKFKKIGNKLGNKTNKDGKTRKKRIGHKVLIGLLVMMIAVALTGLVFCVYIIVSAPEFKVDELYKASSSVIYDADGEVMAELGIEIRENVTYDELPDVLVDAIVATEDSKYFQHSGVDLLRFAKAVVGQLLGHRDAGGASTLTMQIIKNTYSDKESEGIKGIIRKFTDIYMAVFMLEKTYTKQEILEFYVNQPYLGGGISGVEQASNTYFGKSVGDLNLAEAATIAGLFQAPDAYDPFKAPDKAEARRNLVLGLMVRHGYITREEADTAKKISVKDLLVENSSSSSKWQDFIDTVVADVHEKTGLSPYTTSMTIYSTMRRDKQEVVNKLYAGEIFDRYKWVNDVVQAGVAITSVEDGSIVAVGARRNRTGVNQYNYATDIKRHPGSTAKPIFDYGPAIEYSGWGTGTTVVDDEYQYSDGNNINDVDFQYLGIMTAKKALAESRNIPALQAFQATKQADKYEFVTNLGITPELNNGQIMESSSIGAFSGTNPLEISAAYGAFSRGGYYIEPYSFTKIIYNDTKETYTYTPTRKRAMSEETAYMIDKMLNYAVTSGKIYVGNVNGTDLASKTGTTSLPNSTIKQLGLSSSAIRDVWQVSFSPDYSIAVWYGYDDVVTKGHYLTSGEGWTARGKIIRALTPRIMEKNSRWKQPKGVVAVDIELETNPVQLASDYTPDKLRSTEYYKKGTEPTEVSTRFSQLEDVKDLKYSIEGSEIKLSWTPIDTPDAIDPVYLQSYFETNFAKWSAKYYQKRLDYNTENIGILQYEIFVKDSNGTLKSIGMTTGNSYNTTITNGSSETFVVKSTYNIFKDNASAGKEITVRLDSVVPGIPDSPEDDEPIENDEEEQ